MLDQLICVSFFALVGGALLVLVVFTKRLHDLANGHLATLQQEYPHALFRHYSGMERFSVARVGDGASDSWSRLALLIGDDEIVMQPISLIRTRAPFRFKASEIRWFGRPQKY